MTTDRLAALEAAATPGPAEHCFGCLHPGAVDCYGLPAARDAMPELLAVVRAAEEYVSRAPDSHGTALFDDLRDALAALHAKVQP